MDCTTWPEGYEALLEMLDFILEEDREARIAFLEGFLATAVNL